MKRKPNTDYLELCRDCINCPVFVNGKICQCNCNACLESWKTLGRPVIKGVKTFYGSNDLVNKMKPNDLVKEQNEPIKERSEFPAIWDLVQADFKARDSEGPRKYGTPLQGFNGRDALVDAYQEALDLTVYLRQAIYERDGK